MRPIQRPLPEGHENVNYKDHFELRYLRWDYLIKTTNPSNDVLKSKEAIVRYCAHRAFSKYAYEFSFMGMDIDDVENICRTYTVSYLGLYSSSINAQVRDRHSKKLKQANPERSPSAKEMERNDNKSLISFLDQRLKDCAYVFRQRSKGQAGFSYYTVFVQKHGNEWPDDESLISSPAKYGWEKVSWKNFVKIRDMFFSIIPGYAVEIEGKIYRVAASDTSLVYSNHLFGDLFDTPNNSPLTPEEEMIKSEETQTRIVKIDKKYLKLTREERMAHLIDLFRKKPADRQEKILKLLISRLKRQNNQRGNMKEEIEQATILLNSVKKRLSRDKHGKRNSTND